MGGHFDSKLLHDINHWPTSLGPMMKFFSEAANYPSVKLILIALVLGLLIAGGRYRRTAIQTLLAVGMANGMTDLFKHLLPMHRPFQVEQVILRMGASESMGTASAHSANMAAVAFVFVYHLGWWGTPWIVIALITGISRSYNGVHYPSQVALGWLCGLVAAAVVTKAWEVYIKRRNSVSLEGAEDEPEAKSA